MSNQHQNKSHLKSDVAIFILFFIIIFLNQFKFKINQNEGDLLANALHFVNPYWLCNDWYLNLVIPYRAPFNLAVGHSINNLGLWSTVFLGRCISYSFFAWFFLKLSKVFKLNFILVAFFLLYFLPNQSLGAGEWMVRDLETKVFAYLGVLFATLTFYKRQYVWALSLSGFALSLHLLVGLYGAFCLFMAFCVFYSRFKTDLKQILKALPSGFMFGAWGLYGVYSVFASGTLSKELTRKGWAYYVKLRVPHHVLPNWSLGQYIFFTLLTVMLVLVFVKSKNALLKYYSAYTLSAVCLSIVGFLVYAFGPISAMRFYWFRLADVLLPFFGLLILFAFVNEKYGTRINTWAFPKWRITNPKSFMGLAFIVVIGISVAVKFKTAKALFNSDMYSNKVLINNSFDVEMSQWIKNNTEKNAVFIMPSLSNFYFDCERAALGCFKFSPQNAEDILEWHSRMVDLNNGKMFSKSGFDAEKELQENYRNINDSHTKVLSEKYGAKYFLTYSDATLLNAEMLFKSKDYILYKLN